ncbi:hypothetical protein ACGFZA_15930 [Streptomyces sp. NPDC048211]|uniref:hypothetical protein n=1 Tax=Streptomyces sp. NPDC048211 TaxID=3365516 RepID=UPI0037145C54
MRRRTSEVTRADVNAFINDVLDFDVNDVQSVEITPKYIEVREYMRDSSGTLRLDHLGPIVWTRTLEIVEKAEPDNDH